jgi:hypothetical protein
MASVAESPNPSKYPILELTLSDIRVNGGTQSRAGLDEPTVAAMVEDIAAALEEGRPNPMPPGVVFFDDEADVYWLAAGFTRYEAHNRLNLPGMKCEVRPGDINDAKAYACGSNATPGVRRQSNRDKRAAVTMALKLAKFKDSSNADIARHCGVSGQFVGNMRAELSGEVPQPTERTVERNGTSYTMDVANIGRTPTARPEGPSLNGLGIDGPPEDCGDAWEPPADQLTQPVQVEEGDRLPPDFDPSKVEVTRVCYDRHKQPVPPHLFDVFDDAKELGAMKQQLGKLPGLVDDMLAQILARLDHIKANRPGGRQLSDLSYPVHMSNLRQEVARMFKNSQIQTAMQDLQGAITSGMPSCVCPLCYAGNPGCLKCGGLGWLSTAVEGSLTSSERFRRDKYKPRKKRAA